MHPFLDLDRLQRVTGPERRKRRGTDQKKFSGFTEPQRNPCSRRQSRRVEKHLPRDDTNRYTHPWLNAKSPRDADLGGFSTPTRSDLACFQGVKKRSPLLRAEFQVPEVTVLGVTNEDDSLGSLGHLDAVVA